jgi:DNA-binding PadR family transcriptional regulator
MRAPLRAIVADRNSRRRSSREAAPLTDNQGSLLAVVLRNEPVTAYQLFRIYERSPVTSFSGSKGSLYPSIGRLKSAGLLKGEPKGDGRHTETLSCTEAGRSAVEIWARTLRPSHIVLDDPLRTKLLSLSGLAARDQLAWAAEARRLVEERMSAVNDYAAAVAVPLQEFAHKSAMAALEAKLAWLEAFAAHAGRRAADEA